MVDLHRVSNFPWVFHFSIVHCHAIIRNEMQKINNLIKLDLPNNVCLTWRFQRSLSLSGITNWVGPFDGGGTTGSGILLTDAIDLFCLLTRARLFPADGDGRLCVNPISKEITRCGLPEQYLHSQSRLSDKRNAACGINSALDR